MDALVYGHLAVSSAASIAAVLLKRPGRRWLAWGAILLIGVLTAIVALDAGQATVGVAL